MAKHKPLFKIGQVVSVRGFYGNFKAGETRPGFQGKRGWRYGFEFGKIVKVMRSDNYEPHRYFLDGWMSAQAEDDLRALTTREIRVSISDKPSTKFRRMFVVEWFSKSGGTWHATEGSSLCKYARRIMRRAQEAEKVPKQKFRVVAYKPENL
jgi:hypothetical protein